MQQKRRVWTESEWFCPSFALKPCGPTVCHSLTKTAHLTWCASRVSRYCACTNRYFKQGGKSDNTFFFLSLSGILKLLSLFCRWLDQSAADSSEKDEKRILFWKQCPPAALCRYRGPAAVLLLLVKLSLFLHHPEKNHERAHPSRQQHVFLAQ